MQCFLLESTNFWCQLVFPLTCRATVWRGTNWFGINRLELCLQTPNTATKCKQFMWVGSRIIAISLPCLATVCQLVRQVTTKHRIGEIWYNVWVFSEHRAAKSLSLRSSRLGIILPEVRLRGSSIWQKFLCKSNQVFTAFTCKINNLQSYDLWWGIEM